MNDRDRNETKRDRSRVRQNRNREKKDKVKPRSRWSTSLCRPVRSWFSPDVCNFVGVINTRNLVKRERKVGNRTSELIKEKREKRKTRRSTANVASNEKLFSGGPVRPYLITPSARHHPAWALEQRTPLGSRPFQRPVGPVRPAGQRELIRGSPHVGSR